MEGRKVFLYSAICRKSCAIGGASPAYFPFYHQNIRFYHTIVRVFALLVLSMSLIAAVLRFFLHMIR